MFYLRTCLYFDSLLYNLKNMQISLMILYRQQIFENFCHEKGGWLKKPQKIRL